MHGPTGSNTTMEKQPESSQTENVSAVEEAVNQPHNLQRKAAFTHGRGIDHSGEVVMQPIRDFDLSRTIFSTLDGALPKLVIRSKIAKRVFWNDATANQIEREYQVAQQQHPSVPIPTQILQFMSDECDFAVEHADGSFLEHLLFCYDYGLRYFPAYSANVLLLHSILGTGTNTFAMEADKIPALHALLTDFEMRHVEAFPSILRLLYGQELMAELMENKERLSDMQSIRFHRVIDNKELKMTGEDFLIQLNYQLIHLLDFLPVANWSLHASDPIFQCGLGLYALLDGTGTRTADVHFPAPEGPPQSKGEPKTLGGLISSLLPASTQRKLAAKSIRKYSEKIGHSLDYTIDWSA